ncbi:toxin HicA [Pararhodospirillum oryzae]|uniref:Toxin HicA n=1 Tax=Pararhodospirillum oryzae TaxID=478448 RepID=A0A512H5H1_9PROT|nr:toxin HicA [Pararhodospirillum oryzae]GEO80719.1 hypothetical protein ROR02_08500 [Pararhodospirillum oryzae]
MPRDIDRIVDQMRESPNNVRYEDLKKVCNFYFGVPRQEKTSHCVFKTPWQGDPRVNIQPGKNGRAKPYQVKQVLTAIDRIKEDNDGS